MSLSWILTISTASLPLAEPSPVVNASPLIILTRGGRLDLLRIAGPQIFVPGDVAGELRRRGADDPAARALAKTSWLKVVEVRPLAEQVRVFRLGIGESAVLTWALAHPGAVAIIDDLAGRRCAASLGIAARGTLGLVLAARQQGLITAARPVVERLRDAGLYLSDQIIDRALARVGE
jgi:predicted nucleic acid-binding protein